MSKKKPLRKFKLFTGFGEEACFQQVNGWIEKSDCYVVNYSVLSSQGSGQTKVLIFYETDERDGGTR